MNTAPYKPLERIQGVIETATEGTPAWKQASADLVSTASTANPSDEPAATGLGEAVQRQLTASQKLDLEATLLCELARVVLCVELDKANIDAFPLR